VHGTRAPSSMHMSARTMLPLPVVPIPVSRSQVLDYCDGAFAAPVGGYAAAGPGPALCDVAS
jgi:hypothetical protein